MSSGSDCGPEQVIRSFLLLSDDETQVLLSVELLDRGGQIVARHRAMGG